MPDNTKKNTNWTREQTIVAFNVYCKISFKDSKSTHPIIIKFANLIGRSPSALNMKIGNFGRLDPKLRKKGIVGLANGSKLDKIIWDEFHQNWDKLAYQSESLIAKFGKKKLEESAQIDLDDIPIGVNKKRIVKTRIGQSFFRSTVLASYNQKCCITGLSISDFLVASHIIPWSKKSHKKERLNPANGLCLNSIHDKAFDRGFMTITPEYKILLSKNLTRHSNEESIKKFFIKYSDQKITLPDRFEPNKDFLNYHYENIFQK